MPNEALLNEIEAFERMLPDIRAQHGSAWVLMAHQTVQGAFRSFDAAARRAMDGFAGQQVLIRHTSEERPSFPFLTAEDD